MTAKIFTLVVVTLILASFAFGFYQKDDAIQDKPCPEITKSLADSIFQLTVEGKDPTEIFIEYGINICQTEKAINELDRMNRKIVSCVDTVESYSVMLDSINSEMFSEVTVLDYVIKNYPPQNNDREWLEFRQLFE